jgi:hypothetical protein
VLKTRADERYPAASASYVAWSQAPKAHPIRFAAFARRIGGGRVRLNAPGTLGLTYAGAIDGKRIVYRQHRNAHAPADLKLFNLATRKRSNPPPGVNTRRQEKSASLSGNWLLFTRETTAFPTEKIILFNLATRKAIKLDAAKGRHNYVGSGTVEGSYATWSRCAGAHCNVYVYDIASKTKVAVPNPLNRPQYADSVTAAGVVYFAESRNLNCGSNGEIWRYPLGGSREKLVSLPRGHDVAVTDPLFTADGSTTLFYDNFRCRADRADIFKLSLAP